MMIVLIAIVALLLYLCMNKPQVSLPDLPQLPGLPKLPLGMPARIPFGLSSSQVNSEHSYACDLDREMQSSFGSTLENDLMYAGAENIPSQKDMQVDPYSNLKKGDPQPENLNVVQEGFSSFTLHDGVGANVISPRNSCDVGKTFSYGSSLEEAPLSSEQLGATPDYTVNQNKGKNQGNAMNNMNQEQIVGQQNHISNQTFYTNTDNSSGIRLPKSFGSLTQYVIGNGIEVYDDRLKFDENSLVTNDMNRMNENHNMGQGFDRIGIDSINEHNRRVTFVDPRESKKLFDEQMRLHGESDLTLDQVLNLQQKADANLIVAPIKPSNACPSIHDTANFSSNTYTPFSRSIGIHPAKHHAYQQHKNKLSPASHFKVEEYKPKMDYDKNYTHDIPYAVHKGYKRKEYPIDFKKYKASSSNKNTTGDLNQTMYDTNFKHWSHGFKPHDSHSKPYGDAYASCYSG